MDPRINHHTFHNDQDENDQPQPKDNNNDMVIEWLKPIWTATNDEAHVQALHQVQTRLQRRFHSQNQSSPQEEKDEKEEQCLWIQGLLWYTVTTTPRATRALCRAVLWSCTHGSTLLECLVDSIGYLSSSSSSSNQPTAQPTHPLTTWSVGGSSPPPPVSPTALSNAWSLLSHVLLGSVPEEEEEEGRGGLVEPRNDKWPDYLHTIFQKGLAHALWLEQTPQQSPQSLPESDTTHNHNDDLNNNKNPHPSPRVPQSWCCNEWMERLWRLSTRVGGGDAHPLGDWHTPNHHSPDWHHSPEYFRTAVAYHATRHVWKECVSSHSITTTTTTTLPSPTVQWWMAWIQYWMHRQPQYASHAIVNGWMRVVVLGVGVSRNKEEKEKDGSVPPRGASSFENQALHPLAQQAVPRHLALLSTALIHWCLRRTNETPSSSSCSTSIVFRWIRHLSWHSSSTVLTTVVRHCLFTHTTTTLTTAGMLVPSTTTRTVCMSQQSLQHEQHEQMGIFLANLLQDMPQPNDTNHHNHTKNKEDPSFLSSSSSQRDAVLADSLWNDDTTTTNDEATYYTTPLLQHLLQVATVWGSTVFVRQTDSTWQTPVTFFLVQGLTLLASTQKDSTTTTTALDPSLHDTLVTALLQGTTLRLQSSLAPLRLDGMRVGQALAACLGQAELHFEELDQYNQRRQQEPEEPNEPEPPESVVEEPSVQPSVDRVPSWRPRPPPRQRRRKNRKLLQDPDAEYVSEDDDSSDCTSNASHESNDSDDDSVWEELPQRYDLEDDQEDIRETPRPLYLRDALELLRTPETDDHAWSHHETALEELPSLIRRNMADLPDVAVDLAVQVLHQENKYDMTEFGEQQQACLIALLVMEPYTVGMALITDAFGNSCGLSTRLHVLAALQTAAQEFAGCPQPLELESPQQSPHLLEEVQDRVHGKRHLITTTRTTTNANSKDFMTGGSDTHNNETTNQEQALETLERTRRWGRGRWDSNKTIEKQNVDAKSNRFGPVAPHWFYALLGNFVQRREDATLWEGTLGAQFLSHLLLTMSLILDLAGPLVLNSTMTVTTMAHDLASLVWGFCSSAELPELRSAALQAVASSIHCMQRSSPSSASRILAFMQQQQQQENVLTTLQAMASHDPDPQCRTLAVVVASQIHDTFQQAEQGESLPQSASPFYLP